MGDDNVEKAKEEVAIERDVSQPTINASHEPAHSTDPSGIKSKDSPKSQQKIQDKMETTKTTVISTDPEKSQPPNSPAKGRMRHLMRNASPIQGVLLYFGAWFILNVLYILFVYFVLLKGQVQVGPVTFDASTSNLLVAIFSQVVVMLASSTVRGIFSSIRLALAMRGDTSLITFLGIGSTSSSLSIFGLLAAGWAPKFRHRVNFALLGEGALLIWWLGLPLMGLLFGFVLKIRATFENTFVPGNPTIPVFAGLTPIDTRILNVTDQTVICIYAEMWIPSLLVDGQYTKDFPVDGCSDDCVSYIFPGGVDTARQVYHTLNYSLFAGNTFGSPETIRIEAAPAFIAAFRGVGNGLSFNVSEDCVLAGQSPDETLQVCVRQDGEGIVAGWAPCPDDISAAQQCMRNLTWTSAPLKWATKLTAYKQITTTTYNGQNLSIIDTVSKGPLDILPLKASDYMYILQRIFLPENDLKSQQMTSALVFRFSWIQRITSTYFFYEQDGPIRDLRNLLAIPLQFSVNAVQFANFTPDYSDRDWSMPADTLTTATAGRTVVRLVILPWTGWFFICATSVLMFLALAGILFILTLQRPLPRASATGIGDIDILWWSDRIRVKKPTVQQEPVSEYDSKTVTLTQVAKEAKGESAWDLAKRFRLWKVEVQHRDNEIQEPQEK